MNRATFEEAEEVIYQADAAHQEAAIEIKDGNPRKANALALLAIDWRLRALMLSWLEMERPIEGSERKPRI